MVGEKNCQGNSENGPENNMIKLGIWQIKLISKFEMLEPSPGGGQQRWPGWSASGGGCGPTVFWPPESRQCQPEPAQCLLGLW